MARLAALIPKPRVNLIRYHGVFAPNSSHRAAVTPARRGRNKPTDVKLDKTPAQPMTRRESNGSNSTDDPNRSTLPRISARDRTRLHADVLAAGLRPAPAAV